MTIDEIRRAAWQHRDLDITEDYAQGHEQPWASIRLVPERRRVRWATVAGWLRWLRWLRLRSGRRGVRCEADML